MIKQTINFTDYDGNNCTEDFYFNLTKAELVLLNAEYKGGLEGHLNSMVNNNDISALANFMKKIVEISYGVKSEDGKRFIKNPKLSEEFLQTPAFSELYMKLLTEENVSSAFVRGIMPKDLVESAKL